MEMPRRPPKTASRIDDRDVPDDLARWQGADELAALLVGKYRFAYVRDLSVQRPGYPEPGGWVEAGPRLALWTCRAATYPALRTPVEWRVSAMRTRGAGLAIEAWARLAGRDAARDEVEIAVELRRQP